MSADPRDPKRNPLLPPTLAERLGIFIQSQCASDRASGVVWLLAGRSKQDVNGIADDLRHRAIMGKHHIGHAHDILIEEGPEYVGFERLHQRREIGNVGEQHRDLAALTAEI